MIHETELEKSEFSESEIHLKIEQLVFILSAIEQGGQILDVWRNAQNPTALNSVFHNVFQGNDAHIHSLTDNVFRFFATCSEMLCLDTLILVFMYHPSDGCEYVCVSVTIHVE